jgi:hypothetical protein
MWSLIFVSHDGVCEISGSPNQPAAPAKRATRKRYPTLERAIEVGVNASPAIYELWRKWVTYRWGANKRLLLSSLEELYSSTFEREPFQLLESKVNYSIANGYTGLFAPPDSKQSAVNKSFTERL